LLTGRGTFVDDIARPGMLHAVFVRSPIARARVRSIDVSGALGMSGVQAVFLAADLNPDVRESWYSISGRRTPDTPRPPLADTEVRFVGDPIALVVATSRAVAEDASELVDIDYEPLPAVVDLDAATRTDALVHAAYADNVAGAFALGNADDVAAACATAAHDVEVTFAQAGASAAPLEPRGIVAEWAAGEMTIWAATQAPHEVRGFCARALGIGEQSIRVIMRDTGGGFGQKVVPLREELCVMLAARKLRGALKWIEDRRENLMCAGHARHESGTARLALDADGALLAMHLDYRQDVGAYPTPAPLGPAIAVGMLFPGPYRVPIASASITCVFTNTSGRTAYRGPWQFESVAREMALDIAARRIGRDPAEIRRRNLLLLADMPYTNPCGMPYDHVAPIATFDAALTAIGYDAFRSDQRAALAQGRHLGIGMATYVEPTTSAVEPYTTEGATIRIEPSGVVNVFVAGGSTGNSLETTVVQLTADALGVDISTVQTIQGDTALTPFGAGTGGSRSGSMLAGAVESTARELRAKLVALAAHRLEAAEADIELASGMATVRGTPTASIPIADLARTAYFQPHRLPPGITPGLEASTRYAARAGTLWSNATHICTCEVDVDTGRVELSRYLVAEDCGPMINPMIVEGQIAGGTAQGIGGALLEELAHDVDGNPRATTFMDYLLPTAADIPAIEHTHVATPGPGPGGYKGVGEGGAIGAVPAVANAVADALAPLGVELTRVPATPRVILDLLANRRR
jgi:aerobic carbon-monoxide dehydrogenase large subunit